MGRDEIVDGVVGVAGPGEEVIDGTAGAKAVRAVEACAVLCLGQQALDALQADPLGAARGAPDAAAAGAATPPGSCPRRDDLSARYGSG